MQTTLPISLKSAAIQILEWFGEFGIFCSRMFQAGLSSKYQIKELIRQMDEVGSKSLPVVALAGAAIGVVMSMQLRDSLIRFGAKSMLPAVIILSILKETAPIITALVVSGRVAAGIGAELGSMKVTEQIDALEASAVDPFRFLVITRVVACVLMIPLLTLFAACFGILAGWFANNLVEPLSIRLFLVDGFKQVEYSDFLAPVLKTCVFGFIVGAIGCFQGMKAKGGAEGVGRYTTSAVVLSALFVILADVVLVRLLIILCD